METVVKINGIINGWVWGPWMLVLLVGTGVYMSFILGFPQVRYFGIMFKEVFGKIGKKSSHEGSISSFAALATAMAATVGTGNIAGVATALHLGGPGALVWMMLSALFGMTTKFCEICLAVKFREKDSNGNWRGGTMYVIEKRLGMKPLAMAFALFTFLASFGIGNMVQANSTAEGLYMGFGIPHLYTGIAIAFLVGLVIWGGIKSIAQVTTYLTPFMAVIYIAGGIAVIFANLDAVPGAIATAVKYAFSDPAAMPGALAGWSVKVAITKGVARGVFSNEAGLGSAPMVHAAAQVDHPARQGLYGIFEVFMDTIIICSITAVSIIATGVLTGEPELTGAQLSLAAFKAVLGEPGIMVLSIGLSLFSFSTILGWYWYGETAATYLLGDRVITPYKCLWIALVVIGAAGGVVLGDAEEFLRVIWDMADTLNGLMAIPNLIALILLGREVRIIVKDFDEKRRSGEIKI